MKVSVIGEYGYEEALLGLSLSYNQAPEKMGSVARRLCFMGDGHNKFLESIMVWLDVIAPRYFWQQFDTYRVGVTKQSESTMHTITARPLAQEDFAHEVPTEHLAHLNRLIEQGLWDRVKYDLPESFQQRRIVCLSYMSLQRMVRQRRSHRLPEWSAFIGDALAQVDHRELLEKRAEV